MATTSTMTTPGARDENAPNSNESIWLRIIQINDVYELENLASFCALVKQKTAPKEIDKVLVVLAGDFLGPSLLSSLDQGRGMVDCLMACGVTHVCFGNHETDVPLHAIKQRIHESSNCVTWLNTNMRELDDIIGATTTPHDVISVKHGVYEKKVGLLGLLTEDPSVYRPGAFGGATIEPILSTTKQYLEQQHMPDDINLIIPLTHQRMPHDREFCRFFTSEIFPLIIGGHDHEVYDETHCGVRIVKTGYDAMNAAVIDVKWYIDKTTTPVVADKPTIVMELIPTNTFPPDPNVKSRVAGHEKVLYELEKAKIFRFEDWIHHQQKDATSPTTNTFSTANNRLGYSGGTEILTSIMRMAMRASIGIVNAGTIRAQKVYEQQEWFTWGDLKAEIPFSTELVAVELPGRVVEAMLTHSRQGVLNHDPPVPSGAYLHHCNQVQYSNERCKIIAIRGEPFDPSQLYLTALPLKFLSGLDNHVPLLEYVAETPNLAMLTQDDECGKPAKLAIIEMFAALVWLELGSFDDIDVNQDGVLTRDEILARAQHVFGREIANLVVESVLSVADLSQSGTISPVEMMVVRFVASDMLNHVATHEEMQAMSEVAAQVLGKRPSHQEVKTVVKELKNVLDANGSGNITREEAMKVLGEIKKRNLLE